ncbi:MAG: T3SS effector HopA1 family protein [Oculatellaceae cyanobacterium Prado106]|jgi:hypothetical protein|nr:T3SS effector HopA1 family protein [Oculatellaceae cyanobacterium Prado106]
MVKQGHFIADLSRKLSLEILKDIAENVQVESLGCVRHARYGAVEFGVGDRIQQLPEALQQRYLQLQLRNFLHDIYFTGIFTGIQTDSGDSGSEKSSLLHGFPSPDLEDDFVKNNHAWGLNLDFYGALHESNRGQGFFDPGWQIVAEEADGLVAVQQQALTLHIVRDRHLLPGDQSATLGDTVAIKLPRNRLENGCYIAIGDAGLVTPQIPVSLFLHITAAGSAPILRRLSESLNAAAIPFTCKLRYDPQDYPRRDAAVLRFDKCYFPVIRSVLEQIYEAERGAFLEAIPGFTKAIAPGIALAEDPQSPSMSFGEHRCQLIANGLIIAAGQSGESTPDIRMTAMLHQFAAQGLDLETLYLNPGSEDCYGIFA